MIEHVSFWQPAVHPATFKKTGWLSEDVRSVVTGSGFHCRGATRRPLWRCRAGRRWCWQVDIGRFFCRFWEGFQYIPIFQNQFSNFLFSLRFKAFQKGLKRLMVAACCSFTALGVKSFDWRLWYGASLRNRKRKTTMSQFWSRYKTSEHVGFQPKSIQFPTNFQPFWVGLNQHPLLCAVAPNLALAITEARRGAGESSRVCEMYRAVGQYDAVTWADVRPHDVTITKTIQNLVLFKRFSWKTLV